MSRFFTKHMFVSRCRHYSGSVRKPRFYYPEVSKPILRNMALWKLIIKYRDQHSGKKLNVKDKEQFYLDAQRVLEKATFLLDKYTIPVTSTIQIAQVCCATADYSMALTIAEAFEKVGKKGLKMIVEGNQFNDELVVKPGIHLNKICIQPMFIDNMSGIGELSNCLLILYGDKLDSVEEIEPLLEFTKSKNQATVIVLQEFNIKALHDLLKMKLQERLDLIVVELNLEDKSSTTLEDLSVVTGTRIANKANKLTPEEIVGNFSTAYFTEDELLFIGMNLDQAVLKDYVEHKLPQQFFLPESHLLKERVGKIAQPYVALIKIGGVDEVDIRKRMGMAVDTLGRAEQAVLNGIIVGDGRCLIDIINNISKSTKQTKQDGGTIVLRAMKHFNISLYHKERYHFYNLSLDKSAQIPKFFGYDNKSKQYVNLILEGILDPKSFLAQSLLFAKQKCQAYLKYKQPEDWTSKIDLTKPDLPTWIKVNGMKK